MRVIFLYCRQISKEIARKNCSLSSSRLQVRKLLPVVSPNPGDNHGFHTENTNRICGNIEKLTTSFISKKQALILYAYIWVYMCTFACFAFNVFW